MNDDPVRTTIEEAIARVVRDEISKAVNLRRKKVLDLDEAAEYLGASNGTVYNLMTEGKLKPVRYDRRNRFDIDDLDALIRQSKQAP